MSASEKLAALEARTVTLDGQWEMRRILPQIRALVEAAERVNEAHRKIIAGVTPGHPESTFQDEEAREAAWSEWHASCRHLRVVVHDLDKALGEQV